VWLTVGNGRRGGDGVEHVLPDMAALGKFADELRSRIGLDDVDAIRGLIRLHDRLRRSLDAIPEDELVRARAEMRALVGQLEAIARSVEELRRLKEILGG